MCEEALNKAKTHLISRDHQLMYCVKHRAVLDFLIFPKTAENFPDWSKIYQNQCTTMKMV